MKIYNFGSLNIDYVYDVEHMVKPGETISSSNLSKHIGGKGLNQSIALSRAGCEVVHFGCVGQDGQFLVDRLKEEGVCTDDIQVLNTASGHAIIQLDAHGENAILLFAGANHCVEKEYIDSCFQNITSDDLILLQNEISNIDYIIECAYKKKIEVAMNLAPINENIKKIDLDKLSYLLINETEGNALTGESDPLNIGESLIQSHPSLKVVLTLGSDGVVFFEKENRTKHSAFKTQVVDTTAAGDTFTGYFLSMLLRGRDVEEALKIACFASSLAIQIKGAANSIPLLQEVKDKMQEVTTPDGTPVGSHTDKLI